MATPEQLNAFDAATADLKQTADQISVDLAADSKSDAAVAAAQAQKTSTSRIVTDDLSALQTKLDALNAAGAAMGLKINAPVGTPPVAVP